MNKIWKNSGLYIIILLVGLSLSFSFYGKSVKETSSSYSDFINMVEKNKVKEVFVKEHDGLLLATVNDKQEKMRVLYPSNDKELFEILRKNNINIKIDDQRQSSWWLSVFSSFIAPLVIFLIIWMFIIRQAQGGGSQAMSFGKSKAKLMVENKPKVKFDDVAGVEEAKQELQMEAFLYISADLAQFYP